MEATSFSAMTIPNSLNLLENFWKSSKSSCGVKKKVKKEEIKKSL
jgi:hypothetical protein